MTDLAWIAADLRPLARPIASLTEDPKNARRHPTRNLDAIRASLEAHGQRKPIVVRPDGLVLAGNGTLAVARALGWTHLAATVYDGPDGLARAYALADNATADLAEWDRDVLAEALVEAQALDLLPAAGFLDDQDLLRAVGAARAAEAGLLGADPSAAPDVPPVPSVPVSRVGEVYALGPHRLACGDSTDAEVVDRTLAGDRIALVWTDPPYGVAYQMGLSVEQAKILHRRTDGLEVDNDADEDQAWAVARAALVLAHDRSVAGCVAYVATPSGAALPKAWTAVTAAGFPVRWQLVWKKDRFVLGRADYHFEHEPILYGWKAGAHHWCGDRTQSSVLEVPAPRESAEHPTMKPVELVRRMVVNSSRPGDVVYDPFTGSGSTLLACAESGRVFRGVELAPGYADVVRLRWTRWAAERGVDPGPGALAS